MDHRRLLWYLFPTYLIISIIALISATLSAHNLLCKNYIDLIASDLESKSQIVEVQINDQLVESKYASIDSIFRIIAAKNDIRFTLILPDGQVIVDSNKDPSKNTNHNDRSEVFDALQSKI